MRFPLCAQAKSKTREQVLQDKQTHGQDKQVVARRKGGRGYEKGTKRVVSEVMNAR